MASCSSDNVGDEPEPEPGTPHEPASSRSLLVYLCMDNSLSALGTQNLNGIISAASRAVIGDNRIIVFQDSRTALPRMLKIKGGEGKGEMSVVKQYDELDSADLAIMKGIIREMIDLAPADEYMLIYGSHATGWLPGTFGSTYTTLDTQYTARTLPGGEFIATRTIGDDKGSHSELTDFAAALPDGVFDMILFDACLMGSVECAFELRDKAKNIIASPLEVIDRGFPYTQIIRPLFAKQADYEEVCTAYIKYYASLTAASRSASVGWYDTSALAALASAYCSAVEDNPARLPVERNEAENLLQRYDRHTRPTAFDLYDMAAYLYEGTAKVPTGMAKAISDAVLFKQTTGLMIKLPIDPDHYSGVSIYPVIGEYENLNGYYFSDASSPEWSRHAYPGWFRDSMQR